MVNIEKLLLRKEQFPPGTIPPYHPSMVEEGIDFKAVPDLLPEVLRITAMDFRELMNNGALVYEQMLLKELEMYEALGQEETSLEVSSRNEGVFISSIPMVGKVYIGRKEINPSLKGGDCGIMIVEEERLRPTSFLVPIEVQFTCEQMEEYKITEEPHQYLPVSKKMLSPNLWWAHNLSRVNSIFYGRLVMALDNKAVENKYCK